MIWSETATEFCPWCLVEVTKDAKGPMTAVRDAQRWWHQGCLADLTRASEGR